MVDSVRVGGRVIGGGSPCFVIAEAGVNHNGSLETARQLIDVAVDAGADAVKFQTFRAETLVTRSAPKAAYQLVTTDAAESQFEMLKKLELTPDMHHELIPYCTQRGIMFLSTPFDEASADLLVALRLPVIKIPSGEITNLPFLAHVARSGVPMMVSTGMATLAEVATAVETIRAAGNPQVVLLQCVSNYPARASDSNLRAMRTMSDAFGVPVGYSDHTMGNDVALAAVALGACVIEKHITLDRSLPGPDHLASAEPMELRALIGGIRAVESSLGDGQKAPAASELAVADVARKSLVAACRIAAGTALTAPMLAARRPGTGLSPGMRDQLLGRVVRETIDEGTLLTLDMLR